MHPKAAGIAARTLTVAQLYMTQCYVEYKRSEHLRTAYIRTQRFVRVLCVRSLAGISAELAS